jgi:hypothetical protein
MVVDTCIKSPAWAFAVASNGIDTAGMVIGGEYNVRDPTEPVFVKFPDRHPGVAWCVATAGMKLAHEKIADLGAIVSCTLKSMRRHRDFLLLILHERLSSSQKRGVSG